MNLPVKNSQSAFTLVTVLMMITVLLLISGGIVYANLKQKMIGQTATALLDKNVVLDAAVLETATWLQDNSSFLAAMVSESNRDSVYFEQSIPGYGTNEHPSLLFPVTTKVKSTATGGKSFLITFNDTDDRYLGEDHFPGPLTNAAGDTLSNPIEAYRTYLSAKLLTIYGQQAVDKIKTRITLVDREEGVEVDAPSFRIDAFLGKAPNFGSRTIGLLHAKPVNQNHIDNVADTSGFYGRDLLRPSSFATHESMPFKYKDGVWIKTAKSTNAFFTSNIYLDLSFPRTYIHGTGFVNLTNANPNSGIGIPDRISRFKNLTPCQHPGCHTRGIGDLSSLPNTDLSRSDLVPNWTDSSSSPDVGSTPCNGAPYNPVSGTGEHYQLPLVISGPQELKAGVCYDSVSYNPLRSDNRIIFKSADKPYYIKRFDQASTTPRHNSAEYRWDASAPNRGITVYVEDFVNNSGSGGYNLALENLSVHNGPPHLLKYIYTGTDQLVGKGNVQGGVKLHLYAPNARVHLTGTSLFFGNIYAQELSTGNQVTLVSDEQPAGAVTDSGRSPQVDLQFYMDRLQQVL